MTPARLKALALPCFAALAIIAAATATAHAVHISTTEDATPYAEYRNDRWGFSLFVPDDFVVGEFERHGGAQLLTFSNSSGDTRFVVAAWPYTQLDLTLGGFQEANRTTDQPGHLEIVDVFRDEMFTVHFTKNGVRYIVSGVPELEPWLIEILKTWEFGE